LIIKTLFKERIMIPKNKEKPKHLGRGLESLLGPIISTVKENLDVAVTEVAPKFSEDKELHKYVVELDFETIVPNPYQPRHNWNDEQLQDLAGSIKENGVLQPIIVRPNNGKYEIVAGERRFRASQLAGLKKIPAMVRKTDDAEMLALAIVENIHRADLNPIEKAKAYQSFMEMFSLTQEQAAQKLGQDRSVLANYVRLLNLPAEVKQMLVDGSLDMGHARAILALPTDDLRKRLANRALAGRLSVREVERLVRLALAAGDDKKQKQIIEKPANIKDLEEKIRARLGTRVDIKARKNGQRGKIIIEFYSLDEFDSITQMLGVTNE
jgi:ParB family transcriptional regulator, chromosome partitioning protein